MQTLLQVKVQTKQNLGNTFKKNTVQLQHNNSKGSAQDRWKLGILNRLLQEPQARQTNKHLLWKNKQTQRSAGPHVHKDLMSNIIFLLSSIRVKMNVNEMENGEEGRGVRGGVRGLSLQF